MTHLQQPTRTSCGPTCIAMLADTTPEYVLSHLKAVRRGRRVTRRTHSTNVGEFVRLLRLFRMRIGRRVRGVPEGDATYLLRIQDRRSSWHWSVVHDGVVYDPARFDYGALGDYDPKTLSYYEVERF